MAAPRHASRQNLVLLLVSLQLAHKLEVRFYLRAKLLLDIHVGLEIDVLVAIQHQCGHPVDLVVQQVVVAAVQKPHLQDTTENIRNNDEIYCMIQWMIFDFNNEM